MDFSPLLTYKVVESPNVIALVPSAAGFGPHVNQLMIGPLPACVHFLTQYLDARQRGLGIMDAHKFALQGAITLGGGDAPGT